MPTTDFAIIGAGIQGASLAYHLQKSGAGRVTLFERDHPASGATGFSAALVRMYYDNEVEARLAFEGYSFFSNWADVIGGDCGFRQVGVLWMKAPDKADELRAGVAMQRRIGVNTSFITPDQIKEQFPYVSVDGIAGGAFEPESGFADPANTTASMVDFRESARLRCAALVPGHRTDARRRPRHGLCRQRRAMVGGADDRRRWLVDREAL